MENEGLRREVAGRKNMSWGGATPPHRQPRQRLPTNWLVVRRRRTPLLLLLSGAGTAAVYPTADLVSQGRERDAERVAAAVGVAKVVVGIEQPSTRAIVAAATPSKPRVRRRYEVHVIAVPLSCATIVGTIISFIESLTTTGSKGTTVWVAEVIGVDVWWMGRLAEVVGTRAT